MNDFLVSSRIEQKSWWVRVFGIREMAALIPLILIMIATGIINNSFLSPTNLLNILRAASYLFIPAVGMTFILSSRGLDLSIGSQLALSGILVGYLLVLFQLPLWLAIILTLAGGAVAGAINGVFVTVLKIPPFIATLATYYIYRGVVNGITKGIPVWGLPESFKKINSVITGISNSILFSLILFAIATFVIIKTRYGRYVFATGGNEESARLSGVNVKLIKFSAYVLTGILVFASGIFFTSRFPSAPISVGVGFELRVIAACIIGGVSLFGGGGSITGTLIGSVLIVVLENAMTMARVSGYWKLVVLGGIIIMAIVVDLFRKGEISFRKK